MQAVDPFQQAFSAMRLLLDVSICVYVYLAAHFQLQPFSLWDLRHMCLDLLLRLVETARSQLQPFPCRSEP